MGDICNWCNWIVYHAKHIFSSKKREGYGKYVYTDGSVYEGEWFNDKKEGMGKYTYKDGTVYEGEWLDDVKHGTGKCVYNLGNIYEGEFKNGYIHGKGKMFSNEKVYNAYKCEEYLHSDDDGEIYEGNFMYNKMAGTGTYRLNNVTFDVVFEDNSFTHNSMKSLKPAKVFFDMIAVKFDATCPISIIGDDGEGLIFQLSNGKYYSFQSVFKINCKETTHVNTVQDFIKIQFIRTIMKKYEKYVLVTDF